MNISSLKSLVCTLALTAGALGIAAPPSWSQPGPGQRGFWCDTTSGIPTTAYKNSQGGYEPWIRWVSDHFSGSGYDPLTRCLEVSSRLETYRVNKQLKFITVGYMNRLPVICTASQVNGRCEGLIFTLKPGQDAVRTLNTFLAWREGQATTPSLYESGQIPYIDVRDRVEENLPESTSAANVEPVNVVPTEEVTEEAQVEETEVQTDNNSGGGEESGSGELREL